MTRGGKKDKARIRLILAVNLLLVAVVVVTLSFFARSNNKKLIQENLSNIENLNQSAAGIAASYFDTRRDKLADISLYARASGFDLDQTLEYIAVSTASLETDSLQLIAPDCTGFMAARNGAGAFIAVDYLSDDYGQLKKLISAPVLDGAAHTMPEFTDGYSAVKTCAMYTALELADGPYTLMLLSKTRDIIDIINPDGGYDDMSSVLMDADGDYILSNSQFKAMNFFDYLYNYNDLSLDERNAVERLVSETGEGELFYRDSRGRDCVFRYTRVTDSEWLCVTVVPLSSFHASDSGITFIVCIALAMFLLLVVDVTWLTTMNAKLRRSMEQERTANNAKSEFLSRMSHDIRTPLNGIIGSTVLALDEDNPPETAEYLRTIDSSGRFLLGLVNDILDMSKVESGKMTLTPEPYSLRELREYLDAVILPLAAEKGVELRISGTEADVFLLLDRLRFNQICFNLLSNAVKFTDRGGSVEFIQEFRTGADGEPELALTVRDNGMGMSEEFQKHMFDAFSQEDRVFNSGFGAGLGLAIVKKLVELMDGDIAVESRENEGTTFVVTIPAAVCAGDVRAHTGKRVEIGDQLRGRRVLLCEDNEMNSVIAVKMLDKFGVTADTAENGRVGLEMFTRSKPGTYDAVLMDVMMPVMDGLSAARAIRLSSHPDAARVPVIAMTANAYVSDVENCLAAGMNTHVAKPVEPALLYEALAKTCR